MAREGLAGAEFQISGMTCVSCEGRIKRRLAKLDGVASSEADYVRGTARVTFDEKITSEREIASAVESLGYGVTGSGAKKNSGELGNFIGVLLLVGALFLFLNQGGGALGNIFNFFPQAEAGMGYLALAAVGLFTSVHCVAMCGGINLSQAMSGGGKNVSRLLSYDNFRPAVLYNAGRVASYTLIGGAVGALGSAVSFSGAARGAVQIIAGIFMVIMGMNMLGTFGYLRAFAPRMPKFLTRALDRGKRGRGPLYVGLLNGLMPCGPLQAMQIYALSSGSASRGALSMLAFSLGTVPLMFCLGAFGSLMSKKFAGRVMKLGAALVIVMGVVMFNNGTALSGFGFGVGVGESLNAGAGNFRGSSGGASASPSGAVSEVKNFGAGAVQEVTISLTKYGRYSPITVKAGVPVRWTIHADKGTINGCNNAIIIPAFDVQQKLKTGDTVVEFTPTKPGKYVYSCWMGMIRSTITVVDGDTPSAADASSATPAEAAEPESATDGGGAALPGCACCGG